MRMICGVLRSDSGTITMDGMDVTTEEYRSWLGYLPQDFGYYPEFTGMDFLLYMAVLKGMTKPQARRRAEELLELVALTETARKKIKTYSGGMKQRLGIAQALLNRPGSSSWMNPPRAWIPRNGRPKHCHIILECGRIDHTPPIPKHR